MTPPDNVTETGDTLLYLGPDDVLRALQEVDAVAAVREALSLHAAGRARVASEAHLPWSPAEGGEARSISMPALVDGEPASAGVKVINANTANPASGLARASGLTLLFDVRTARPRCVMTAAHISALRTAAVTVLASQRLLSPGAATAAIMGAGALARHHCLLIAERLPQIKRVLVFDSVPDRSTALCRDLATSASAGHVEFEVAPAAQAAAALGDLLITCTTTRRPYIGFQDLKPGAVAVNVSLDDLAEDVFMSAAKLYVDDWQLIADDDHRLLGHLIRDARVLPPGAAGGTGQRAVTGTIGQLIQGQCPGRDADSELCVVNPFGLAIEDIALAHRVYLAARRAGIGTWLPL